MTFEKAYKQKEKEIKKIEKQFYGYPLIDNDKKTLAKRKELELQLIENRSIL